MAESKSAAATAAAATPSEVADFRKEQVKEWGTYVAVTEITFNGALAYNRGDAVPVSNVEAHGYLEQKLVAKIATKDGQEVISSVHQAAAPVTTELAPTVSRSVPVQS